METILDKKAAARLVRQLVKAAYIEYKAYVDAYKLSQGCYPARNWIRIRLSMEEAEAFLYGKH